MADRIGRQEIDCEEKDHLTEKTEQLFKLGGGSMVDWAIYQMDRELHLSIFSLSSSVSSLLVVSFSTSFINEV